MAHQLAPGDIRTYPPSKYVHHHDSQAGKSFAENLHSCFCLGVRDIDSRVCTIHYSKIRANVPSSPLGLVRIHDHYVDVNLVTDKYKIVGKKIVSKDEVGTFKGGEMEPGGAKRGFDLVRSRVDNFGNDFLGG